MAILSPAFGAEKIALRAIALREVESYIQLQEAMIVCLCKGVSDRDVARAIEEGADSVEAITGCTGAGSGCGRCRAGLAKAVDMAHGRSAKPRIILPMVAALSTG
jgi:bacterioferritin-associated ferredoxin